MINSVGRRPKNPPETPMTTLNLRFPTDLYDAIRAAALADERSITGFIVFTLRARVTALGYAVTRPVRPPPPE